MTSWFSGLRAAKRFPDCTGPFAVGCTDFMCGPSECHGVCGQGSFLRLFYPADKEKIEENERSNSKKAFQFPRSEYSWGLAGFVNLPGWLFGSFLHWSAGHVEIPAWMNAPLINIQKYSSQLPCVVFAHGLGANRLMYSTYCCELASHGCLVAIVEHRDSSASATYVLKKQDGTSELVEEWMPFYKMTSADDEFKLRNTQLKQRSDECVSALNILEHLQQGTTPENLIRDQQFDLGVFKGRLDVNRTALLGHSFGGATVVATLAREKRFRCGLALDVWMLPLGEEIHEEMIDQPLFFINSYQFHRWRENIDELEKLVRGNPDKRPIIALRNTSHMSQCDVPFMLNRYLSLFTAWKSDHLDPFTADRLYKKAMWAFLCRHLGIGSPTFNEPIIDGGEDVPEHIIIGVQKPKNSNL